MRKGETNEHGNTACEKSGKASELGGGASDVQFFRNDGTAMVRGKRHIGQNILLPAAKGARGDAVRKPGGADRDTAAFGQNRDSDRRYPDITACRVFGGNAADGIEDVKGCYVSLPTVVRFTSSLDIPICEKGSTVLPP